MPSIDLRRRRAALGIAAGWALGPRVHAESGYPTRTVRVIAPFAAGGAADSVARFLQPLLNQALGQPVIIENRTGASGAIGSAVVAKAAPDGYTLLCNLGPPHQTVQFFTKGVTYDPVKDFSTVAMIATAPQALIVNAASPIRSIADFVQEARRRPEGLSYATSGTGTSQHLAGLILASSQQIKLTHVPYRGGSAAVADVLGGQVETGIVVLSNVLPHIASGKLRVIGIIESTRAASAPTIPTLAEGGLTDFAVPATWVGLLGPRGLPADIVARLHAAVAKAAADDNVRAQLVQAGYSVAVSTPEAFAKQLADGTKVYERIVAEAGISPE